MSRPGALSAVLLSLALLGGCTKPGLRPEAVRALEDGLLRFVQDGKTTREEALMRLGTPMGRFEGDRILTWDFVLAANGEWFRVGQTVVSDWRNLPPAGGCSLVLVFDAAGLLACHSLVRQERDAPPAPAPEA